MKRKKRRKISDFKIKVEKFSFFSASLRKSLFCQGRRMNTQWWQMSMTRALDDDDGFHKYEKRGALQKNRLSIFLPWSLPKILYIFWCEIGQKQFMNERRSPAKKQGEDFCFDVPHHQSTLCPDVQLRVGKMSKNQSNWRVLSWFYGFFGFFFIFPVFFYCVSYDYFSLVYQIFWRFFHSSLFPFMWARNRNCCQKMEGGFLIKR